jgi:hypothetical protein
MNIPDHITIQAFLLAIPKLDIAVSPALHQAIRQVGEALAQRRPEAVAEIRHLVEENPCIQAHYVKEYEFLSQQYQARQGIKSAPLASQKESEPGSPLPWEDIAANILMADDFKAAARSTLKQLRPQAKKATDSAKVFFTSLQHAVAEIDAHAIAVLQTIERRPLTAKGLTYVMGISLDQAVEIVQWLWQAGYIERTSSSVFQKVFPGLRQREAVLPAIDPDDTYFTLTSKGHFLLHPVVTLGSQGGTKL